ncbi:MAG: conjugal transfer protein TraJ [Myxococcales bacterium]|nr:conjugal transfer protein TraJ [Myxococcales bacterium]
MPPAADPLPPPSSSPSPSSTVPAPPSAPPPTTPREPRRSLHLRVPVTAAEAEAIKAQADATGLSKAAYLRRVGLGYQPPSALDHERVDQMLRVNADLGRIGGLLKLWLTDDAKLQRFDAAQLEVAIGAVLGRIDEAQQEIRGAVRQVLRRRHSA